MTCNCARRVALFSAVLFALGWTAVPSLAGLPTPYAKGRVRHKVVIPKLHAPATLETDLNQPPWTQAAVLTGNLDWRRVRTADVPVWTYLFYDDEALWVACRNEMSPGSQLKYKKRERDESVRKDDNFEFWLDVGRTGRVYYKFFTNPAGSLYDAFIVDKTFDSHATVKTSIDPQGWTAILRIPFADLGRPTPSAGTTWAFNSATRMGTDNSWAPVLGGYHIPEEFALLVFGGADTPPIRMTQFDPIRVGSNTLRFQAPAKIRYRLEFIDGDERPIQREEGTVSRDGRVRFELPTDQARYVNFTFTDAAGRELLSFWRPVDSPAFSHKLPDLETKAGELRAFLERCPADARTKIQVVIEDVDRFLARPITSPREQWDAVADELRRLERRVTDAWLFARTQRILGAKSDFALALAAPTQKVMIRDFPCPGFLSDHYDLALARNEHEGMQVVVIPYLADLKDVTVSVTPPRPAEGESPFVGKVTVSLVGHVETRPAGATLPDYVGWYPDPLLHFQHTCDAAVGEHVAFWIDVATQKTTPPGEYRSTITVTAAGRRPVTIPLAIRVWDIELPDGTHLGNAFTYAEPYTKRLYKGRWSKELAYKYYDFILDHRLNIDSLYGKELRNIEMLKYGAQRGMNAFNLFYIGKGASADRIRQLLEERMPPLQKAGLDRLAYVYGFDEVNDDVFPKIKELFGLVHKLYPNLRTMTTGYDTTYGRETGLRDYVDIWVPLVPRFDMDEAKRLRAEGKDMWWYICVGPRPPFPNWFVESPAIEARLLMGAMSYKYQAGGVLYFMTNLWKLNDHPITSGPYTDWFPGIGKSRESVYANGDGSIFCAGPDGPVTTIRYENIRDGLEDYEYLYALAETLEAVQRRPTSVAGRAFIERARALLAVPDEVVESSARYTHDPERLESFRRQVAQAILEGRRLLK